MSPQGCRSVTAPPGAISAGYCNFDREEAQLTWLLTQVDYVFVGIALLLIVLGVWSLITGRHFLPASIERRIRHMPARPRDQRMQGLTTSLGGLGALLLATRGTGRHSKTSNGIPLA
jgi:hypothetical protein